MIKSVSLGGAGSAVGLHLITGGTNATPIVVTVAANSGLKTGDRIAIGGITGLTAMNGIWTITVLTATTFSLDGSVGNGTYGGTPRMGLVFDRTPLMRNHSALMTVGGNCIGTLLLESFASLAEFTAGDNSLSGAQVAPVPTLAYSFITNTAATSASTSTIASSSIVIAATAETPPMELKLPYILRVSLSAYTSGSIVGQISA